MNDSVDDLLQEAGAQWRASQPPAVPADPARFRRRRRVNHWVPVAAAAAVIFVAAGLVYAAASKPPVPQDAAAFGTATARPGATAADALVVRDGARVHAIGKVLAEPGKPVRFCAPAAILLIAPPRPGCGYGVPVVGVDLTKIASAEADVELQGLWQSGVLTVTKQSVPASTSQPPLDFGPVPCQPPAGGWKAPGVTDNNLVHQYVMNEHPDQFRRPWMSSLGVIPTTSASMATMVQVMVVEVVKGDAAAAGRELRSRYAGNLCVVDATGRTSVAEQKDLHDKARRLVDPLMNDAANGIYQLASNTRTDLVEVDLVMLTPALHERFATFGAGLDLRPWLRPLG